MARDWLAIYATILGKPKYRRLSLPARAALFHVWLLAGSQAPEATWSNEAELTEILELDGFPPDVLTELLARRWLDVDEAGRVTVHDWDEHQLAATVAARRAYEADRKREWRRRPESTQRDPLLPAPSSPDRTATSQDITGQVSRIVRDTSGTFSEATTTNDDLLTCPDCGDGPLNDRDTNVAVANRRGQMRHLRCPGATLTAAS